MEFFTCPRGRQRDLGFELWCFLDIVNVSLLNFTQDSLTPNRTFLAGNYLVSSKGLTVMLSSKRQRQDYYRVVGKLQEMQVKSMKRYLGFHAHFPLLFYKCLRFIQFSFSMKTVFAAPGLTWYRLNILKRMSSINSDQITGRMNLIGCLKARR